ncbi:hypothetical protein HQO12_19385 [Rhodococcus fascians]|uniref:hypothetical protein n=1 Tax=Rhodococcoides fascians TaxID=1828 RepID=UPI001961502B|nr:hypothetical protein [Rhodococcus fascians]MBM7245178.1 hypothetical protein [Rhodococcus fascians]MBY3811073.1 hypothetical protein [Rhodococcus fascians]MBY3842576.1 hypothetical protein [Rhodococcus fascians]MBY3845485.1 hypothetical protein [Rhodococcus fascians]MBY3851783.1 hypothetical protein [Rhodococcus fascians]
MNLVDIGTFFGVVAAVAALFIQVRQRKFALAQQYIERFWEIDDSISIAEFHDDKAELDMHRRRYAKLCEDEMEIVSLGWIDRKTWSVWHHGMVSAPSVSRAVTAERELSFLSKCRLSQPHTGSACPAWKSQPLLRRLTSF